MNASEFAQTPQPPYYAVIFSSLRREGGEDDYADTAKRMVELASIQPGFLGVESVRGAAGFGITVSFWQNEASIQAWKRDVEHTEARRRGRVEWYEHFELRVAKVERAYCGPRDER